MEILSKNKVDTKNEVMFKVFAPRALEPILMSIDIDTTVGQIADIARVRFGYEDGVYTLQNTNNETLEREKSLKNEHVKCGDSLELVSTGGGVFLIPTRQVITFIASEIEAVGEFCDRKKLWYLWDEIHLQLKVILKSEDSGEEFYLLGTFDDYPALPPAWEFKDSNWQNSLGKRAYPKPHQTKFGSSIFHSHGLICVPFNRLAYTEQGGLHADWGGCANWKNVKGGLVSAQSVPDMLAVFLRDFIVTKSRLKCN